MKKFIWMCFLIIQANLVYADEALDSAKKFVSETNFYHLSCTMESELLLLKNKPLEEAFMCTTEHDSQTKDKYSQLKKMLSGNSDAIDSLKDYYVYWRTSMDGIVTDYSLSKYEYNIRKDERSNTLKHKGERFILDVEL